MSKRNIDKLSLTFGEVSIHDDSSKILEANRLKDGTKSSHWNRTSAFSKRKLKSRLEKNQSEIKLNESNRTSSFFVFPNCNTSKVFVFTSKGNSLNQVYKFNNSYSEIMS